MSGRGIGDLIFSSKIPKGKETQLEKQTQLTPWPGECAMKGEAEVTGSPAGPRAHRVFGDASARMLRRTPWDSWKEGRLLFATRYCRRETLVHQAPRLRVSAPGGWCVEGGWGHPPPFERGTQAGWQGWPAGWRLTSSVALSGPLKTGPQTKIVCVCVCVCMCAHVRVCGYPQAHR